MVEITIGGGSELERSEADVVQGLVVDAEGLVGVSTSWWTERVAL